MVDGRLRRKRRGGRVAETDKFNLLCINRPNSFCCDNAVYNESNKKVVFDIANSYDLLSGIQSHIDCHKRTVNVNKTEIIVTTITLNDLLYKSNAPLFIEYLSLDTEGSEFEILKSVDFNKYKFGLIDVENREDLTSNIYYYRMDMNISKKINGTIRIDISCNPTRLFFRAKIPKLYIDDA